LRPGGGTVAFFLPNLHGGGAERVTVNLAEGMTERGVPVDLVVGSSTGALREQLTPALRLVDLHSPRVLRSLGPLIKYLRHEQPSVLISSMSHANVVALWAARLAGRRTPVIVTVHNTMSQSTPQQGRLFGRIWPKLLRIFYPWARHVVAVSAGAADDLAQTAGLPRSMVKVVYNPVLTPSNLAQSRESPDHPWLAAGQPPVVLGVGRLTRQKDFVLLIRAFAAVRRRRCARLIILGEGEQRAELEGLVGELGLERDVSLPGYRDNAMAYMARSNVFVLSSAWEGLPTVLIEALGAGTQVVSTDCPSGPREILQGGRLGALVPVGDIESMTRAITDALERPGSAVDQEALAPFTRDAAVGHYLSLVENA
jgi:glycosyltransferase involved in cell wall biosynthesis